MVQPLRLASPKAMEHFTAHAQAMVLITPLEQQQAKCRARQRRRANGVPSHSRCKHLLRRTRLLRLLIVAALGQQLLRQPQHMALPPDRPQPLQTLPAILPRKKQLLSLLLLAMLHGLLLGLMAALPLLLLQQGFAYRQHIKCSLAFWPYCLRLLWAPFIEESFKTYFAGCMDILPAVTHYTLTVGLLRLANAIEHWLNCHEDLPTRMDTRASQLFLVCLLAAALEIGVDAAWLQCAEARIALRVKRLGRLLGYACGYVALLLQQHGALPWNCWPYVGCWAVGVFVAIHVIERCQHEQPGEYMLRSTAAHSAQSQKTLLALLECYRMLLQLLHKSGFVELRMLLLTLRASLLSLESLTSLDWVRGALLKNHVTLAKVMLQPLHLSMPLCLRHWGSNKHAMNMDSYLQAIPQRVSFATLIGLIAYCIPHALHWMRLRMRNFYATLLAHFIYYQLLLNCLYITVGITSTKLLPSNLANGEDADSCGARSSSHKCSYAVYSDELFAGYHVEFITCLVFVLIWLYLRQKQVACRL